jgi:hypothetical protein
LQNGLAGDAVDARALALDALRFCLRDEAGRAAEWYNDDRQLGASIGAACSVRQACAAWPAGYKTLLRLLSCSSKTLLGMAELDLTTAAASGQLSPGVGGALAVLVASSTNLQRLSLAGGDTIGLEGVAPLVLALRRNTTLLTLQLDGEPLHIRSPTPPHVPMLERPEGFINLTRKGLGPLSSMVLGALLEGNTSLRSLNLYRNRLKRISGLARALCEPSSALTNLDLAHNGLGPDAGFELSEALRSNSSLTALSLYSNHAGEAAAAALWASAQHHAQLLELNLISNGLSVQARDELRASVGEWLAVRGLRRCTAAFRRAAGPDSGAGEGGRDAGMKRGFLLCLDGTDKPQLTLDGVSRDVAEGMVETNAKQAPIPEGRPELAQGKRAWASAEESPLLAAANATDGKLTTRWASGHENAPPIMHSWWPQWLAVDLGEEHAVLQVRLTWEDAYAASYEIQGRTSEDGEWVLLKEVDTAWAGEVVSALPQGTVVRQLRVRCLRRGTEFGYSIRRLQVY